MHHTLYRSHRVALHAIQHRGRIIIRVLEGVAGKKISLSACVEKVTR